MIKSIARQKITDRREEFSAKGYSSKVRSSSKKSSKYFKLGDEKIYINQLDCANRILRVLFKTLKVPSIFALPQGGKSGVIQYIAHKFKEICTSKKDKYCIIFLTHKSDNGLKNQTGKRIIKAGIKNQFISAGSAVEENEIIIHILNINDNLLERVRKMKRDGTIVLLICDESHLGLGKNGNFSKLTNALGIKWGFNKNKWSNKNVFAISVSATSYAEQSLMEINKNAGFSFFKLEKGDGYYSFEDMIKANRLREAESIIYKKGKTITGITPFLYKNLEDFEKIYKKDKGYMILRVTNSNVADFISTKLKSKYNFYIFSSKSNHNPIEYLDDFLKKPATDNKPMIVIIINACSVGYTYSTTKNIRLYIESFSVNKKTDTAFQRDGRNCGYQTELDTKIGHSKFKDTFLIYTNIKKIENGIKNFNDMSIIPDGVQNTSTEGRNIVGTHRLLILNSENKEDAKEEIRSLISNIENEIKAWKKRDYIKKGKEFPKLEKGFHISVITQSENATAEGNYAHTVRNFQGRTNTSSMIKDKKMGVRIVILDKVSSKIEEQSVLDEHRISFTKIRRDMPQVIGKYVYALSKEEEELLKTKGLLRKYYKKGSILYPEDYNHPIPMKDPKINSKCLLEYNTK